MPDHPHRKQLTGRPPGMITASPGVIIALLVVLAARRLHTSGGGYGLLAAIAAGALTGPILLTRLPTRTCRPIVVFTAFGRGSTVHLVLASITALPAALAALVCYRVGTSTGNVASATIIQSHVPDGMRGRVFSGSGLIWQPMRLASLLLGGLPAGTAGIRLPVLMSQRRCLAPLPDCSGFAGVS
jgi:hypothetical protein